MEDYDDLVAKCQSGEINDLEFLLAQEDLAAPYVTDMQAEGVSPNAENAAEWLLRYENEHLYQ
jgi:hypothetical protein